MHCLDTPGTLAADHVLMIFIARRAELMRLHGQVVVRGIANWCVMMGGRGVQRPGGIASVRRGT